MFVCREIYIFCLRYICVCVCDHGQGKEYSILFLCWGNFFFLGNMKLKICVKFERFR
jgi:hypothetical protein